MNKKGAEMTVGTIVWIVLALIVLVVLVVGFTGSWSNLWMRITSFFGGSNIDSVVRACQVACTTESKNDFCERERTVKADAKIFVVDKTTKKLIQSGGDTIASTEAKSSCKTLAEFRSDLGFEACPDLCTTA